MSESSTKVKFKENIIKFLKANYSKKDNLKRLLWFFIAIAIVLIPAIPLNVWAYQLGEGKHFGNNNFLEIDILFNQGNGYGFGSDWPQGAVYFVKIFTCFILLIILLLLQPRWYYTLPLGAAFVGGLFNVFDKVAHDDNVIDYLNLFPRTSPFGSFNVPDLCITTGIIFTCVSYVVVLIIKIVKDKKTKKQPRK